MLFRSVTTTVHACCWQQVSKSMSRWYWTILSPVVVCLPTFSFLNALSSLILPFESIFFQRLGPIESIHWKGFRHILSGTRDPLAT